MNNIETRIKDAVEKELNTEYLRNKHNVAVRIAERFGLHVEDVESDLQDTIYSDMFSTGTIYWHIHYGDLVWYTRPKSKRERSAYMHKDLEKLKRKLEK